MSEPEEEEQKEEYDTLDSDAECDELNFQKVTNKERPI